MQVTHWNDGEEDILADNVRRADGLLGRVIGLMGQRPLESGEAMVFRFSGSRPRHVHTLFVRAPIDVLWLEQERVQEKQTIHPWSLGTRAHGDTVVELPRGRADKVVAGDIVTLDRSSNDGN